MAGLESFKWRRASNIKDNGDARIVLHCLLLRYSFNDRDERLKIISWVTYSQPTVSILCNFSRYCGNNSTIDSVCNFHFVNDVPAFVSNHCIKALISKNRLYSVRVIIVLEREARQRNNLIQEFFVVPAARVADVKFCEIGTNRGYDLLDKVK